MDGEWLAARLAAGRSIESIAREAGRAPSTVAYWMAKFGLVSQHAAKHARRGGIEKAVLEELVARGLSTRAMAAELGVSQATVRHWLGRLGLKTATAERRRLLRESLEQEGVVPTAVCAIHGRAPFRRRADGGWRCLHCASAQVAGRRRRVKELLVAEAGGRCVLCGYDGYAGALQFHHVDPADKDFGLALRGVARSLARARAEAAKCVLLCANCHAEVEGGLAELP